MEGLFGSEVVSGCSRAQAIEDGMLVDVSLIEKTGFSYPVAVTRTVWERYIEWNPEDSKRQTSQDVYGRLHDILQMLKIAIRSKNDSTDVIFFRVNVVLRNSISRAKRPRLVKLKAICGPGDNEEPVITIMLPDED